MRGFQSGLRTGVWLAVLGAVAFAGVLALSSAAQPSGPVAPNAPLGGTDDTAGSTDSTVTSSTHPGPFAADTSRIQLARQELTEFSEDGPYPATVIAEDVPSPLGGPDPSPLDPPFGANVQVENAAGAQRVISIAAGAGQDLYVAYENPGFPTDVRVAKSTNGGTSWSILSLGPAVTYNRRNPDAVFSPPNTVIVFFEHDDAAASTAMRYLVSGNGGSTWATHTLNFPPGFGFANLRLPGANMCSTGDACVNFQARTGPAVLVAYEGTCTRADCAPGPGARQSVFLMDITPGTTADWTIEIYSSGDATGEGFRPQFIGSSVMLHLLVEFEDANDASWDLFLFRIDQMNGTLDAVAICFGICSSDAPIYGSVAVKGRDVVFGGGYHNPAFFTTPFFLMQVLYSNNDGGPLANWDFIQATSGSFEPPAADQKYLNLAAVGDVFHAAYRGGGELSYWISVDGNTWAGPYLPSDNGPPGTVPDTPRSVAVAYGAKVGIAFLDNRDGDDDPWFATLSGASMYVIRKSPASIGGTINIDTANTPVPAAFIWNVGTLHPVLAPDPEAGPAGTQYVWQSWSDGLPNPHDISVVATDQVVTANYRTQHRLTMTSTVAGATLLPGDSWQDDAANVLIECVLPAGGPNDRYTFRQWIGSGPGSSSNPSNPDTIVMLGPIQEVCDAAVEYRFRFDTLPTGLQLRIDGIDTFTPSNFNWWADGSVHTVNATSPQSPAGPLERYTWFRWTDSGAPATRSFTASAGTVGAYVAEYRLEYQVQVLPNPADCDFWVDGTEYTAAQTFWFVRDTTHFVDVTSPQGLTADIRYVFGSWDDGGLQAHPFQADVAGKVLRLTCITQYRYQFDSNPPGQNLLLDGSSYTMPRTEWWVAGSSHTAEFVTVGTADTRQTFDRWTDGNLNNPRSFPNVASSGSFTVVIIAQYVYTFDTVPTTQPLLVDGIVCTTPCLSPWWDHGSTHSAEFQTVPIAAQTQRVFVRWTDASTANPRSFANIQGPAVFIVQTAIEYEYVLDTAPTALDLDVDGVPCPTPCAFWFVQGSTHTAEFQTVPLGAQTRRSFVQWTDASTANPRSFVNIQGPGVFTAQTVLEYEHVLNTVPTGLALEIDTVPCTAPCRAWFAQGSTHSARFPSPQSTGVDAQRVFAQWSDAGVTNPRTFSGVSSPLNIDAQTYAEYRLSFTVTPAGAGIDLIVGGQTITPSGGPSYLWIREGSSTIEATSPQAGATGTRYVFDQWSDGNLNDVRPITVTGPASFTAVFQTQHELTVDDLLSPLPIVCNVSDCWYDEGSQATVSVASELYSAVTGIREKFIQWTGDATGTVFSLSSQILMSGPKSVSAEWQMQVRITVTTQPTLSGLAITVTANSVAVPLDATDSAYWVEFGASVVIRVPQEATIGGPTYRFVRWTPGGSTATSLTIPAAAPIALIAEYRQVGALESPVAWGGLTAAIVAAAFAIAFFLLRRRKREPEETIPPGAAGAPIAPAATTVLPPPPSAAAEGPTMECPSCGLTIPAKSGACPVCGAAVEAPPAPAGDDRVRRLEEAYGSGRISYEQYQANLRRIKGAS